MNTKNLFVKNMVCDRCIRVVKNELEKLGLIVKDIQLGKVEISNPGVIKDIKTIEKVLVENGFELLVERKARIVEKIKNEIIALIHDNELEFLNVNLSDYLSKKLSRDYSYLSTLFSSVESITIEKYFILQKIEKVKEYIVYDEYTLSEISHRLGYSSVQHLSGQFKKVTGLTPTEFKRMKMRSRKSLDKVGK